MYYLLPLVRSQRSVKYVLLVSLQTLNENYHLNAEGKSEDTAKIYLIHDESSDVEERFASLGDASTNVEILSSCVKV